MRSRRTFLAALMSGAGSIGVFQPQLLLGVTLPEAPQWYRKWLGEVLPREDRRFDPFAGLLVSAADGGPGYHTKLRSGSVHGTRDSLTYAVACLDSGEGWRGQRAREVIKNVLVLQDQDPASKTYGLWPWYLEESLEKMAPPDLNWADYCGTQLLMAWMGHRERLGKEQAAAVQDAIVHAARSIQKRNVEPSYTNIAIMGTFVTLAAAQEFHLADLRAYARERLRNLYSYITQQGSLTEYNSPTYSLIAVQELSRMMRFIKDSRDTALVAPLHELAWKHIATHFHPPTRQWAGPHSRSYETDVRNRPSCLAFLQAGTGGRASFRLGEPIPLNLEAAQVPLECPRRLARLFTELERARQVTETFVKANPAQAGARQPIIGTTWLHPHFTIGSVSRGDFWSQRRPLLLYWGNGDQASYCRARFLKDDVDFASALIFSAQTEGYVISTVVLSTDHGDKHPSLDPIPAGTITARDLRLRLEFGGDLQDFAVKTVEEGGRKNIVFMDRRARFVVRPLEGRFGDKSVQWDFPELKTAAHVDAVLHQGEFKSFALGSLTEAFACFALFEWPYEAKKMPSTPIEFTRMEGQVRTYWKRGDVAISVMGPVKPASFASLNDAFRVNAG